MSKKTIGIIIGVVLVIVVGVAVFFVFSPKKQEAPPANETNVENTAVNLTNNNASNNGSIRSLLNNTSTSTSTTNIAPENTSNAPESNISEQQPQNAGVRNEGASTQNTESGPKDRTSAISDYTDQRFRDSAPRLVEPDTERAKTVATDFVNGFYYYNQEILQSNMYTPSFSGLIAPETLSNTGPSELIYVHANREWQEAVGSYPKAYSVPTSVEVGAPTVSGYTHYNSIMVPMTVIVDRNQDTPGTQDWSRVNTYKLGLAVYLDDSYQVIDVREQTSEVLNINIFNEHGAVF